MILFYQWLDLLLGLKLKPPNKNVVNQSKLMVLINALKKAESSNFHLVFGFLSPKSKKTFFVMRLVFSKLVLLKLVSELLFFLLNTPIWLGDFFYQCIYTLQFFFIIPFETRKLSPISRFSFLSHQVRRFLINQSFGFSSIIFQYGFWRFFYQYYTATSYMLIRTCVLEQR